MKIKANSGKTSIHGRIISNSKSSAVIPKYVTLFNRHLKSISGKWALSDHFEFSGIRPGTYVVRVSFASGLLQDTVVQAKKHEEEHIEVNFKSVSTNETNEWAYFSKFADADFYRTAPQAVYKIQAHRFTRRGGRWTDPTDELLFPDVIYNPGKTYYLKTAATLSLLRLSCEGYPDKYIWLPPGHELMLLIRPAEGPLEAVHPLEALITTEGWKAETVMTLLKTGEYRHAQSLMPEEDAEQLLYDKRKDPAAAAIGGYFLLKTGALSRLHNWAENLSNWFEWLPDGAVIHARQLLMEGTNSPERIRRVRDLLLEAIDRGLPVFTEGFRLLYDSLLRVHALTGPDDWQTSTALNYIRDCAGMVDWSLENTTFNAAYADLSIDFFNSLEQTGSPEADDFDTGEADQEQDNTWQWTSAAVSAGQAQKA